MNSLSLIALQQFREIARAVPLTQGPMEHLQRRILAHTVLLYLYHKDRRLQARLGCHKVLLGLVCDMLVLSSFRSSY